MRQLLKFALLRAVVITSGFYIGSCRTSSNLIPLNEDHIGEIKLEGTVKSIHVGIAAPRLIFDSLRFNARLQVILKSTNEINVEDATTAYCHLDVTIDSAGIMHTTNFYAPPSMSRTIEKVLNDILLELDEWEPAYIIANPEKKVAFRVTVVVSLKKSEGYFKIAGPEEVFVKNYFNRPL
ncbi:MAG: hypothetical protein ABJA70_21825 [Chryseolinea sp.]